MFIGIVRQRAGIVRLSAACGAAASLGWLVAPCAPARADGRAVLMKMSAVYETARSFQGQVVSNISAVRDGKTTKVNSTMQLKFKSPNLFWQTTAVTVSGTIPPGAPPHQQLTTVSDGKSIFLYSDVKNQYATHTAPPTLTAAKLMQLQAPPQDATVKELAPSMVAGHATYTIEVTLKMPSLPATITPAQRAQVMAQMTPIRFMVDKSNYHLLQISRVTQLGSTTISFPGQVLNPAFSASLFVFTPPRGAKLFVPPAAGMQAPPPQR